MLRHFDRACINFLFALALCWTVSADSESSQCSIGEGESCQPWPQHSITGVASAIGCNVSANSVLEMASGDLADALECIFSHLYPKVAGHSAGINQVEGGGRELTYGELQPVALAKLLDGEGLAGVPATASDKFVDLGSGTGKLPFQAFLLGLQNATGIELAKDRHEFGAKAVDGLHQILAGSFASLVDGQARLSLGSSVLTLISGDLLLLPLTGSTVVFAASLCFPEELLEAVAMKLRNELAPGAFFWSLRELPANQHEGLVLVRKNSIQSTWSSHSSMFIYVRVPTIVLPPFPTETSGASDTLGTWVVEILKIVHAEFVRLRGRDGDISEDGGLLRGEDFASAIMQLKAVSQTAGLRLLHSFGTPNIRSNDDHCGCLQSRSKEWSMAEIEFARMVLHGVFPKGMDSSTCLSTGRSCTAGDRLGEYIFQKFRHSERCKSNPSKYDCNVVVSDLPDHYECSRTSDGLPLLHHAIFRDKAAFASIVIEQSGNASWLCTDNEGQGAIHLAAKHASEKLLAWILDMIAQGGAAALQALNLKDAIGQPPLALAKNVATLESLLSAGADKEGIHAVDQNGASPLYRATFRSNEDLVVALLKHRGDASINSKLEVSPLIAAAKTRRSIGADLVRMLVAHRADLHVQYGESRTQAIHLAVSQGNIDTVEALLDLGAKVDAEALGGIRPRDLSKSDAMLDLLNRFSA